MRERQGNERSERDDHKKWVEERRIQLGRCRVSNEQTQCKLLLTAGTMLQWVMKWVEAVK